MAPVNEGTAGRDLKNIAIAAGEEQNSYVGVRKPDARKVFRDDDGSGGSTKNWFNLDGTPVPSGDSVWLQAENGGVGVNGLQAYAFFKRDTSNDQTGGKLNDIEDKAVRPNQKFNKAVMKCCGGIPKTFCPAEGDK